IALNNFFSFRQIINAFQKYFYISLDFRPFIAYNLININKTKERIDMNNVKRKEFADKIVEMNDSRLNKMLNSLKEETKLIKEMIYSNQSNDVDEDWKTVRELIIKSDIIEIELEFR